MNLKEFFQDKKTTPYAWAKANGFEPSTIWRIAEGKTTPSLETAQKIVSVTKGKVGFNDLV